YNIMVLSYIYSPPFWSGYLFSTISAAAVGKPVNGIAPDWPDFLVLCRSEGTIHSDLTRGQDGDTRFYTGSVEQILTHSGEPEGRLVLLQDVTEQKQAENLLREEQQFSKSLLDSLPGIFYLYTYPEHKLVRWNKQHETILGYTAEEMKNRSAMDWHPPEARDAVMRATKTVMETGQSSVESSLLAKDGHTIPFFLTGVRFEAQGRLYYMGTGTDITERKRAEGALQENEELFREVFNNANDAIFLHEMTQEGPGKYILVNDIAVKSLGYTREEFQAMSPWDIVPRNILEGLLPFTMTQMHKGGRITFKSIHARKDGSEYPVEVSTHIFPFKGRNVSLSIVRDITDRIRSEEALHEANKKLNLLSSITRHDVNNQLMSVNGFLELLHKKVPDPTLGDYFTRITKASNRISTMIQFTKEYEQIGVNSPAWQDIRSLVETAAKEAPLGQVTVKNDLPAGWEVLADPLIVKVFYNLMDNAVRYGGKITTIRYSVEESGDVHLIICEDDGEGIPAEDKEKIFKKGFGKNTGLGLFLAREILDITGITIRETGEPGKGARFEMVVPKGMWRIS
ncbi:MAG: PAS domain-containing sensor histidine kinase, partial [Methanomicrobiales archaeon]